MAGYFLYTLDNDVFSQLTTSPTKEQGDALAEFICEDRDAYLDDFDDESEAAMWPKEQEAMCALIAASRRFSTAGSFFLRPIETTVAR